jgi:transposase
LGQIFGQPGAGFVRRRPGEAFHPDCIISTVKFGGGSIMVWGCMSARGTGEVFLCDGRMNATRYTSMLDEVLEASILRLFEEDNPQYYFQQDNAPCHKAMKSMEWFSKNKVPLLEWPPQSPDLSPIENLWATLKKNVWQHKCTTKESFKKIVRNEWAKIEPALCEKLVCSMPKRVRAVIKAQGGTTKY